MTRSTLVTRILQRMLHELPRSFDDLSIVAHLTRGAGWPRGGWLVTALPEGARRELVSEGYEVTEDRDGRIIVEPPAVPRTTARETIAAPMAGSSGRPSHVHVDPLSEFPRHG